MTHYTTLEQSKKLVELGLNPDTADMKWYYWKDEIDAPKVPTLGFDKAVLESYKNTQAVYLPCWSLGALMDLLPPSVQTGEGMQNQYEIDIRKYWGEEENLYQIAYGNDRGLSEEWHDMINTRESENLIDVALDMVCWLLENGYLFGIDYLKKINNL